MERESGKLLVILAIVVVVLAADVVEGGRKLTKSKDEVKQPQTFFGGSGGMGGLFPSPGSFAGVGFGPSGFCTFPGGCTPTPVLPTIPGGSVGGGSPPHA